MVALVVGGGGHVRMPQPWGANRDRRDSIPSTPQLFWIKGGVIDMSGWGLPIADGNPMPSGYQEMPLDRVPNPCPNGF